MDILMLANCSGGLYQFRADLITKLQQKHQVMVSVPNSGRYEQLCQLGCDVIETAIDRRGINPMRDIKLLQNYLHLLRHKKPELVITYTIKPNIYGGLACRLLRIPYAANITGLGTAFQKAGWLRNFVTLLYREALKKAKVVFFENEENMQTLLDARIVKKAQCVLLHGAGVNLEHFPLTPYPEEADRIRFLFMGRVMREKGVDELFSAMERLVSEGYPCELDVLGDYEEDYKETIHLYVQQGWLHYHGFQPDVRPFIRQTHCFVLPSWHEGMANTNLESASMGRPVITSNIHGCKEAVDEGKSGLLCNPKDADSLYASMKVFLQLSHTAKAAMGMEGRRHMEIHFDKKTVVENTLRGLGL